MGHKDEGRIACALTVSRKQQTLQECGRVVFSVGRRSSAAAAERKKKKLNIEKFQLESNAEESILLFPLTDVESASYLKP